MTRTKRLDACVKSALRRVSINPVILKSWLGLLSLPANLEYEIYWNWRMSYLYDATDD